MVACVASVSMQANNEARAKIRRRGWGRGRKETLVAKHCDFQNRPLGLSCLTDFTLSSSSIQVAFVILVLARFEILDHFSVYWIRIIQVYPRCQIFFFRILVTNLRSWAAKPLIKLPPFSLIRDFGKQNIRGNVSKISVNHTCYRQIGSKFTNHSPLTWRKEVAVIGGSRSDLSITRKTDGNFGNLSRLFCFPKSRIKENGGKSFAFRSGSELGTKINFNLSKYVWNKEHTTKKSWWLQATNAGFQR